MPILIKFVLNIRCREYCMFLFPSIARNHSHFFFCETDVPDARATDDVHRRDKNVSLFVRLYLHWNVRLSSPYILIRARSSSCRYSEDASNGLPKSYRTTPSTKFSTIVPNTLHSRMEMNMNSPYDPDHCFISFPDPCVSFLDLGRHGRSQKPHS